MSKVLLALELVEEKQGILKFAVVKVPVYKRKRRYLSFKLYEFTTDNMPFRKVGCDSTESGKINFNFRSHFPYYGFLSEGLMNVTSRVCEGVIKGYRSSNELDIVVNKIINNKLPLITFNLGRNPENNFVYVPKKLFYLFDTALNIITYKISRCFVLEEYEEQHPLIFTYPRGGRVKNIVKYLRAHDGI